MHLDTSDAVDAGVRFHTDTASHGLTVLHDDGLYRHLRFRDPKSSFYWYDLTTWPGALCFRGDVGMFTFTRETDMFGFFRTRHPVGHKYRINPGYWAEKTPDPGSLRRYDEDLFKTRVNETIDAFTADLVKQQDETWTIDLLDQFRADVADQILDNWDGHLGSRDLAIQLAAQYQFRGPEPKHHWQKRAEFTFNEPYEWSLDRYDWAFLWACHGIVTGIEAYDAAKASGGKERAA